MTSRGSRRNTRRTPKPPPEVLEKALEIYRGTLRWSTTAARLDALLQSGELAWSHRDPKTGRQRRIIRGPDWRTVRGWIQNYQYSEPPQVASSSEITRHRDDLRERLTEFVSYFRTTDRLKRDFLIALALPPPSTKEDTDNPLVPVVADDRVFIPAYRIFDNLKEHLQSHPIWILCMDWAQTILGFSEHVVALKDWVEESLFGLLLDNGLLRNPSLTLNQTQVVQGIAQYIVGIRTPDSGIPSGGIVAGTIPRVGYVQPAVLWTSSGGFDLPDTKLTLAVVDGSESIGLLDALRSQLLDLAHKNVDSMPADLAVRDIEHALEMEAAIIDEFVGIHDMIVFPGTCSQAQCVANQSA